MPDTDMGGPCSCDAYDGDMAEVYRAEIRKARKKYLCYECGKPIKPGERYEYAAMMYDGAWDTCRTHLACAGIRRDFCCNMHGSVAETFEETYGFDPWEIPEDDDE